MHVLSLYLFVLEFKLSEMLRTDKGRDVGDLQASILAFLGVAKHPPQ